MVYASAYCCRSLSNTNHSWYIKIINFKNLVIIVYKYYEAEKYGFILREKDCSG